MFYLFVLFFVKLVNGGTSHGTFKDVGDQHISDMYHPLLLTLKDFHIFTPQQFDDFHLNIVKRDLYTHHPNITGLHVNTSHFTIKYHDRHFILDLFLNHQLLPSSFSIETFDKDGKRQLRKPLPHERNHCYYQGQVRNEKFSQVVLSTCYGLRGYISTPNDFLVVEPLIFDPHSSFDGRHVVYKLSDVKGSGESLKCGNGKSMPNANKVMSQLHKFSDSLKSPQRLRRSADERKFVELVMVADFNEARNFNDRVLLDNRIKEIVNILDGFYQRLNIRIVLSHVEVWNHTNQLSDSTNAQEILDEFLNYRSQRRREAADDQSPWVHADNFHLLFGKGFDGATVGMATVGTMCGDRSGGVNQDTQQTSFLSIAAIIAHEMGHNFGMLHDTGDCFCKDETDCLMAASLGSRPMRDWSNCSAAYLQQNLRFGLKSCLLNIPDPSTVYGGPECGNEILEQGEECDCGTPETCPSDRQKCCNPSTCTLQPAAKCDVGQCCRNCQFLEAGSVCRAAETECGLSEYCTGTSPYCPGNVYKLDGSPCSSNSMCFDGVCMNHDMQCLSVWGSGASSSVDGCYIKVNTLGDEKGNCGITQDGSFRNCSVDNVKCGKLICQGGGDSPTIGRYRTVYEMTLSTSQESWQCKTIASKANDVTDLGLVRTGTKCDDGKFCKEGSCIPLPTRALTCSDACNGRGVCNSLYNCHCDDGWAPPYCNTAGSGGSINSGPTNGDNIDIHMILLIVLIGLVLPLIVILFTFVWYRYCGGRVQIKTWKKNRQKRLELVAISKGKVPKLTSARSSSFDNLVDTPTVTFTTAQDKTQKYLVSTGTKPSFANSPSRPPPPTKTPSKLPAPTRPHYSPIVTKPPPARKAPEPPSKTQTKPARPPPRPALPPNAWSAGDAPAANTQDTPISVKERLQRFDKM